MDHRAKWMMVWGLLLAWWVVPVWADGQVTPGQLTVASYNVEWMLDVFEDPYTQVNMPPKPREKLVQIAKAIRTINPDVVTFAELENEGVLRAFVHEMLADMNYQFIACPPTNSDRGQNLGIISRVPIASITSHRFVELSLDPPAAITPPTSPAPRTWRFARDLMQVQLQVGPNRTVDLYMVHLKSKGHSPDDPKSAKWRLAEAQMIRKIIQRQAKDKPDAWYILQGDLNDTPNSPTIQSLVEAKDSQPALLVDVHASLPKNKRRTYLKAPYDKEGPIDYIFTSPALSKRLVPDSAKVLDDPALLTGSDHAPVSATFEVKE